MLHKAKVCSFYVKVFNLNKRILFMMTFHLPTLIFYDYTEALSEANF